MMDLMQLTAWLGLLATGIGGAIALRALGLASTYVRDLLHVGAGVWILGWPYWSNPTLPIVLVAAVAAVTAVLPRLAPHSSIARHIVKSVTNGDEHWTGLVHYTAMYTLFTMVGLTVDPFPAAAGLLALSLGDGIGGAVGRNFGRHHFQLPGAKRKSIEGSVTVLVAAAAGAALAAHLFGRDIGVGVIALVGVVASAFEALAPRSSDNLLIPIAVWSAATLVT